MKEKKENNEKVTKENISFNFRFADKIIQALNYKEALRIYNSQKKTK